ncbi:hypothetical protein G6F56_001032 [Rhizopus delemar]|nr:hypothetical protein G6F56_001032 [Rhizopus delemar]
MECEKKYSNKIYNATMECFDSLPLAAVVNDQFLCVHGGLSPELRVLSDIDNINRFRETPTSGIMCDLVWADPYENFDDDEGPKFEHNHVRGCSYFFGYNAVCNFVDKNKLLSVIRAHEAQANGYRMYRRSKSSGFPSLMTIFSAPNYIDVYNNKAAILRYDNNVLNIRQFNASPHPYRLPNFKNVFDWSLPFVGEKEELSEAEKAPEKVDDAAEQRRQIVRNKIIAVGKISSIFSLLRENSELITELKNMSNTGRLPTGTLGLGAEGLKQAITTFEEARRSDIENERLPPTSREKLDEIHRKNTACKLRDVVRKNE